MRHSVRARSTHLALSLALGLSLGALGCSSSPSAGGGQGGRGGQSGSGGAAGNFDAQVNEASGADAGTSDSLAGGGDAVAVDTDAGVDVVGTPEADGGGVDASADAAAALDRGAEPDGGPQQDVPVDVSPSVDMTIDRAPDASVDSRPTTDAAEAGAPDGGPPGSIANMIDVSDVWSGHPVGFALLTRGNEQFAAFYDAQRQMTVAQRTLDGTTWRFARLASTLGWDSHNYVTMAIDSAGFIHVAGNMHAAPLIYFRTTQPMDIGTFQRVPSMVGSNEQSCTYPQFVEGPGGDFVFAYRDGTSGNGNYVFNTYAVATKTWRRLINSPLMDGQGLRNAYPVGPTLGPDGWWHLVYVWRDTPDAATNHDLSYAKSRDLVNWQSGTGRPLTLPITLASSDIVDAVPPNGGMINNNTKVGFDSRNLPVIGYHKFDAAGNTQLYNARVEAGRWVTHRTSNWNFRWAFGGGGTLVFQIQLEGVRVAADGKLIQVWNHMQYGGWSAFQLDEATLASVATLGRTLPYPATLERVQSTTAGMGVRWAADSGAMSGGDPGIVYMLRWETLPENQDQPRATIPPATRLRLYGFRK